MLFCVVVGQSSWAGDQQAISVNKRRQLKKKRQQHTYYIYIGAKLCESRELIRAPAKHLLAPPLLRPFRLRSVGARWRLPCLQACPAGKPWHQFVRSGCLVGRGVFHKVKHLCKRLLNGSDALLAQTCSAFGATKPAPPGPATPASSLLGRTSFLPTTCTHTRVSTPTVRRVARESVSGGLQGRQGSAQNPNPLRADQRGPRERRVNPLSRRATRTRSDRGRRRGGRERRSPRPRRPGSRTTTSTKTERGVAIPLPHGPWPCGST
jgi:hypothetical protein